MEDKENKKTIKIKNIHVKTIRVLMALVLMTFLIAITIYWCTPKKQKEPQQEPTIKNRIITNVQIVTINDNGWLGSCLKTYEISFGYDNIHEIIANNDSLKNICHDGIDKIDAPKILGRKLTKIETHGSYSESKCRKFAEDKIINQIGENILEEIYKNGKLSLQSEVSPRCKDIKP